MRPPFSGGRGRSSGTWARTTAGTRGIAAEGSAYTIALDADHGVVERLYRALDRKTCATILPLVGDIADPSPGSAGAVASGCRSSSAGRRTSCSPWHSSTT